LVSEIAAVVKLRLLGTSDAARYFFFFGAGFAAFLGVLQAIGFLLMGANVPQRNRAGKGNTGFSATIITAEKGGPAP
jgi:hypothetical protein